MSSHILAVVVANLLIAMFGCGLLPLFRLAGTRRELATRALLGYAVGLAATGILAADLAVVYVPLGRVILAVLAIVALGLAIWRLPGGGRPARPQAADVLPVLILAATLFVLVPLARLLAVKPLDDRDGWEIWGLRARALYDFGHPVAPVFTDPLYAALQHPLLLPGLEALDFRFMGAFDGTAVHVQLLGFAIALVGGGWTLLRGSTRPLLLAATLLAVVVAPTFLNQIQTNYADVPLATFVALGVAALATWLRTGEAGMLPAATLFLAAAALTKNEGECFALTAFVAALIVARSGRRRPLLIAAAAVILADLPWRIWLEVNQVKIAEYSISNLFNPWYLARHADRVWPNIHELWFQISVIRSWSYLVPLALVSLVGAASLRRYRMALFGALWLLLSFAALVAIYWISTNPIESHLFNSSDRTIDSLVITAALLAPVVLFRERDEPDVPMLNL